MLTDIFWIAAPGLTGRLGTSPRPRGGDWLEDELRAWRRQGVDHVASLLEAQEEAELGLEDEAHLCATVGLDFTSVPVLDRGLPVSIERFREVASMLHGEVAGGHSVVVHCRQGIGRASLLAAAILAVSGLDGEAAFEAIELARGRPVPDTEAQRAWLVSLARSASRARAYTPGSPSSTQP